MRRTPSISVALSLSTFGAALIAWSALLRARAPTVALRPEPIGFDWTRGWTEFVRLPESLRMADLHELLGFLALFSGFTLAVAAVGTAALVAAGERALTQQTAVRAALGASPARLRRERMARRVRAAVRHALPTGVLLGALAFLAVRWTRAEGLTLEPGADPLLLGLGIAAPVLAAALLAALPFARRAAHRPAAWLLAGGRATRDRRGASGAAIIATLQIAASLALLAGAGLLLRHGPAAATAAASFTGDTVAATVRLAPGSDAAHAVAWNGVMDSLAGEPAVEAAAFATTGSELGVAAHDRIIIDCGRCIRGLMYMPLIPLHAAQHAASPGWLALRGADLLEGEGLHEGASERIAVVNHALATEFERGRPIGRRIWLDRMDGPSVRVVGIVDDAPAAGLGSSPAATPAVYLLATQMPPTAGVILMRGPDAAGAERILRDTLARVAPGADVLSVEPLGRRFARAVAPLRWFGRLFLVLAVIATGVAAIGVAAALRLEVRMRARELAIRAALGASPASLRRLVLRRTLGLVARGAAGGLVLALLIGRGLQESLTGVPFADPFTALIALAVLSAAALLGAMPAARRAAATLPAASLNE